MPTLLSFFPSGARLHNLNSFLLLLSFGFAVLWPFETLLVSYAVLGPLHYLTEISWLHDRQYFLKERAARFGLWVGLGLLLLAFGEGIFKVSFLEPWRPVLLFLVFMFVPICLFIQGWTLRLLALLSVLVFGIVLNGSGLALIFAVYLATIVHVFVFTGIFMWNGIRNKPDKAGGIAFFLFLSLPIFCFLVPVNASFEPSSLTKNSYGVIFAALNRITIGLVGNPLSLNAVFTHPVSIFFSRFIALAYTYHYLNWFSKPSVIQWHKISGKRWTFIGVCWLMAVCLYAWNYVLGFAILATLSFAHVVLEFPLNHMSFRQLIQKKKKIIS